MILVRSRSLQARLRPVASFRLAALLLLFASLTAFHASAQTPAAQTSLPQADRVLSTPFSAATVRLPGYVPAWLSHSQDLGEVAPETALRVTFVLARSPEREQAFTTLLADQSNPRSPRFHHWLTPAQIGTLYGPTPHDLDVLTAWLSTQGLRPLEIAPSGVFVTVEAPASSLARTFGTSLHRFRPSASSADAAIRLAVTAAPSLPVALQPLVRSVVGLSDVPAAPTLHTRLAPLEPGSGSIQSRARSPLAASPRFSYNAADHVLSPADFNVIYDINPVLSNGINGTGQSVAIIGLSRVLPADLTAFETLFSLAAKLPTVVIPSTGLDPGLPGGGLQEEATLDVSRVLATAPGAHIDLVVTTPSAGGLRGAAQYEVQTLRDPILSLSFHQCEVDAGPSGISFWDTLFAQAAAEGISSFVASGDTAAADCADSDPTATQTLSINAFCASSYVTCVGGTEFADLANPSFFWSASNGSAYSSANDYIPEGAWNEPSFVNSAGLTVYGPSGTGGGVSTMIPKPSWQTGAGVPADGFRDIPDVSFSSSGHDGYIGCSSADGADCVNAILIFSGTSVAAPSMAGIAALLNQKLAAPQGNLNPLLYRLYRNADNDPNAINTFHDVTPATSTVVLCTVSTPSTCNNSTPGSSSLAGGLAGYPLTPGYDLATGLGSLDVQYLLWAAADPPPQPETYPSNAFLFSDPSSVGPAFPVTLNAAQIITFRDDVFPAAGAGTITGTVQFLANGVPFGPPVVIGADPSRIFSPAQTFPTPGTYTITAAYSGNATFTPSISAPLTVTITPAPTATTTTSLQITSSTVPLDGSGSLILNVTPTAASSLAPSGAVELSAAGVTFYTFFLGRGQSNSLYFSPALLPVGTSQVVARYLGDDNFLPSVSAVQTVTVTKGSVSLSIFGTQYPLQVGTPRSYSAMLSYDPGAASPSGSVEFFIDGVSIGSAPVQSGQATSPSVPAPSMAGSYAVTAVYSGDANWLSASSASNSFTTTDGVPYTLSAPTSFTVQAGEAVRNSVSVTVARAIQFAANINLACKINYNGPGPVTGAPTCEFAGNFFQEEGTSLLLVETTAPHPAIASITSPPQPRSGGSLAYTSAFLCALVCLVRRPRRPGLLWTGGALLSLLFIVGCGGSGSGSGTGSGSGSGGGSSTPAPTLVGGTTPGSYTITVSSTNTAGAPDPAPLSINLTVQ